MEKRDKRVGEGEGEGWKGEIGERRGRLPDRTVGQ